MIGMFLLCSSMVESFCSFDPVAQGVRYLFIDFNSYFACVEQHDDATLRGRPVIVTPLKSEHSGAIAASYEAKALGISRGTSVIEARRLCPDIAIRSARHDRYVEVHDELMREIERHLPIARIHSIDECVCRLSREEWGVAAAIDKAHAIKAGIAERVGPALRCSIGLASSPMLAKLACELQKPDGLTVLPMAILPHALADLPLRAIPGVGEGVSRRLAKAGIGNFLQLWDIEPKRARAIWGTVEGERFIYGLRGHDLPLTQESAAKRMISHSRVLGGADRRPERARIVARALLLKAASRLRLYGLYAGGMNLSVRLYPDGALSQDIELRGTRNSWQFLRALDDYWHPMMDSLRHHMPSHRMKLVSVYLHRLSHAPPQPDLFVPLERDARAARLWQSIDELNRRYGKNKVGLASQQGLDLNYLGVKIAFSRIPDRAEFAC